MIKFRHEVKDLGSVDQGLEAVSEAARNEHHALVVRGEFNRVPFQIGGRFRTNIDRNVINRSACTAHELGFFIWRRLEMQAAKRSTLFVEGYIALNYRRFQAERLKFTHAETACEKATFVGDGLNLDDIKPG